MKKENPKRKGFARLTGGKGYYIVLALCAAAVCTAAFAAISGVGRKSNEVIPENFGNPESAIDQIEKIVSLPQTDVKAKEPEKTPETTQPAKDTASPGAIITEEKKLEAPLSGTVATPFSAGAMVYSPTMNDYREHTGTDVSAEAGTAVKAAASGTIDGLYYDDLWGQVIIITHTGGVRTIYKNLDPELPANIVPGARVEGGTVIGKLGEQGIIESAEPAHLHFEIEKAGVLVNPEEYVHFSVGE